MDYGYKCIAFQLDAYLSLGCRSCSHFFHVERNGRGSILCVSINSTIIQHLYIMIYRGEHAQHGGPPVMSTHGPGEPYILLHTVQGTCRLQQDPPMARRAGHTIASFLIVLFKYRNYMGDTRCLSYHIDDLFIYLFCTWQLHYCSYCKP